MSYLRELFTAILGDQPEEVEARSLMAFSLAIGHHFLAAGHGDQSRTEVLRRASRILESGGSRRVTARLAGTGEPRLPSSNATV